MFKHPLPKVNEACSQKHLAVLFSQHFSSLLNTFLKLNKSPNGNYTDSF